MRSTVLHIQEKKMRLSFIFAEHVFNNWRQQAEKISLFLFVPCVSTLKCFNMIYSCVETTAFVARKSVF